MPTWATNPPLEGEQTASCEPATLLEVQRLTAGYGPLQVIRGISFRVLRGEWVALIGPNGSGKTTSLRAVAGLIRHREGTVNFKGQSILGLKTHERAQNGLIFISEDLNLFPGLSARENLLLGAYSRGDGKRVASRLESVLNLFPVLKERLKQLAGTLSGGERRMLGIARGLMSDPSLLLVDEPSLGLAPPVVDEVFRALRELNRQGVAILLAEQNVNRTLRLAARGYVLENGRIALHGASRDLLETDHVRKSYLGLLESGQGGRQ